MLPNNSQAPVSVLQAPETGFPKESVTVSIDAIVAVGGLSETVSATDVILDTSRVGRLLCEPIARGCSCVCTIACLCIALCAESQENNRPATRRDVVYADQIRRQDAREVEAAAGCGANIGVCVPRVTGALIGGCVGFFRAAYVSAERADPVLCYSRAAIERTPSICAAPQPFDFM